MLVILSRLLVASVLFCAATSHATTYVWSNDATEDQVHNSGVGDGSTDSSADGEATLRFDSVSGLMSWDISWNGLEGLLSAIHIHGPADSMSSNSGHFFNIFTLEQDVIDSGVDRTTGSTTGVAPLLDLILETGGMFGTDVVIDQMVGEMSYVNIHSTLWPMGEIRAHLFAPVVLESQTKGQQKCSNSIAKQTIKADSRYDKVLFACATFLAKKGGGSLAACRTDAQSALDAKAVPAADKDFGKKCEGLDKDSVALFPEFAVDDALATAPETGLGGLLRAGGFVSEVNLALEGSSDPEELACVAAVSKRALKCSLAIKKTFATCLKKGLAGKNVQSFVTDEDVDACAADDPKGKVAKLCGADTFEAAIDKSCDPSLLPSAFVGASMDPSAVAEDLTTTILCDTCQALRERHGFAVPACDELGCI